MCLPEGKPPFSYWFSYVFPLKPPFSYGFPMVFPLKPPFSYGFHHLFVCFSFGLSLASSPHRIKNRPRRTSRPRCSVSHPLPKSPAPQAPTRCNAMGNACENPYGSVGKIYETMDFSLRFFQENPSIDNSMFPDFPMGSPFLVNFSLRKY